MNPIRLLDKSVAGMIAAGEVVERPASAVKELLENSIDAGASAITLEIKNGGVAFIRVTDNGCGMPREDAPVAFLRHATSKVRTARDLEAIGTLGFRGEALASISAVSKVEMLTRTAEELSGTRIAVIGGEAGPCEDAGCPQGTTILVRELFFNTPARMKFLKKDTTEANAVSAVAERIALSHPEISVRFIKDGREGFHTPGDNRQISAVRATLGRDFAGSLIAADYELNGVKISGFITKPVYTRSNRNFQFFFLNGRLVKSKTALAALEEAFKGSIMVGKYPGCVLHIRLSPSLVDVNVHPAKIEVRFANEHSVFEAVYYAVKNALAKQDTRPEFNLGTLRGKVSVQAPLPKDFAPAGPEERQPLSVPSYATAAGEDRSGVIVGDTARPVYQPVQGNIPVSFGRGPAVGKEKEGVSSPEPTPVSQENAFSKPMERGTYRVVGQCFDTYILVEAGGELLLIDKHAAHERILYEEIRKHGSAVAQMLLEPVTVTLSQEECSALVENSPILRNAGFDVTDFGGATVLVRAAPSYLKPRDIPPVVEEIASGLAGQKKEITPAVLDSLYHSVACRAAVKAGDKTGAEEARRLAARVLENDDIRYCPHGRPVVMTLTQKEIEKNFKRIQ